VSDRNAQSITDRLTSTARERGFPNVRPRDAATLIIIDRSGKTPKVLMGRRHPGHKFMPGKFVFPGGRIEPGDRSMPVAGALRPRAEVDRAESNDFALGGKPMRPRDAATLILIDWRAGRPYVLLGRRHARHAFMPGKFVFPGGRTDPADSRIPVAENLHPAEEAKLLSAVSTRCTPARARAIALSAVRETYEEAGLLIGKRAPFETNRSDWQGFSEHGVQPSLAGLRLVARAITPPGRVRRFDSRFLAAFMEDVAVSLPGGGPTNELQELVWLPVEEAQEAEVPAITRTVLKDLEKRLKQDPDLSPGGEAPFYRMVHNRFQRDLL